MFDFGFSELMLIGVLALIVLGPDRLPKAARSAGNLIGRVQRMVSSVKQELSAQLDMEELRRAKNEFEATADSVRTELKNLGEQTQEELSGIQEELNELSDGLEQRPAWERLPQQRTPADFGVDHKGEPLHSAQDAAWAEYLMPSEAPAPAAHGFQTASLRQQAMRRKRDMRPRYRPKPQLRVRKK
ncbi:Sec-independent protein translocase protein TatB [Uruburuella testudinis]|uniref:Sec-independent protein translocase protein TatB n=1 Tax=Uruburuella testudinis TaxID=1282863 RepID=A0ABY4DTZ0_9NEIS|nr:Sec-independent protein translocase protein TatB [Uruburuella testudinis]UOO82505.1 Sec-independent protein translocase protein TatB [Uruburuella testudinis]